MSAFDPAAATAAYLAELTPQQHALATAYTQGGHWLLLWGFLVSALTAWIIIRLGVLQRMSNGLQKNKPRPWLTAFLCALVFFLLDTLIELPWAAYSGWWREGQYHLTSQSFGGWLSDAAKGRRSRRCWVASS
jgi:STE24 endopeptidase